MISSFFKGLCNIECIDIAGTIASGTAMIGFLPQVFKIFKTKSVDDLSALMITNFMISSLAFVIYGLLAKAPYVFVTNAFSFTIDLILLSQLFYYRKK